MYIPYLEQPSLQLGPVTIHAFGVIVAGSVLVGLEIARRRFAAMALDPVVGQALAWWTLVGGFVGAHLFSVLLYFPEKVARNPLVLFKFWEDISSFGGILGGLIGMGAYLLRRRKVPSHTRWEFVDAVAFTFPFALAVGRVACTLAHDHPGTVTSFPLAVSLATEPARAYITHVYASAARLVELPPDPALARLGFHDLGWYELLVLGLAIAPATWWLGRTRRRPGAFVASFILLYMPVRFALDFLRVADAQYAGLTPAQWSAGLMLLALPLAWRGWWATPLASEEQLRS